MMHRLSRRDFRAIRPRSARPRLVTVLGSALLVGSLLAPTAGGAAASAVPPGADAAASRPAAAKAGSGENASLRQRGKHLEGLAKASFGPCKGYFKIDVKGPKAFCTHGPDLAPQGTDVTIPVGVPALRRQARSSPFQAQAAVGLDGVPCIGDGTSGKRIQAIYAVASDKADRYASVAPLIRTYAGHMDAATNASAAQTGGERHLRFVMNPDCTLNVAKAVLSPTGDDTFANTINELRAKGFNLAARKYHVWVDANVYCGIGQIWNDDSATNNANDSSVSFARSDNGCWDYAELHEVFHNLGAVQLSAPHQSGGWHCTDEYDLMCYKDSASVVMTYPCAGANNVLLDCNHDDYFHTSPGNGSYLATHWNTANSGFLSGANLDPDPDPDPTPPPTSTKTWNSSVGGSRTTKTYSQTVNVGPTTATLTFALKDGSTAPPVRLRVLDPAGKVVAEATGPSPLVLSHTIPLKGKYKWQIYSVPVVNFKLELRYRP